MGNTLQRNRYWWYKSLYDDYMLREFRTAFAIAGIVYLPFYWWGVHFNREIEVNQSHEIYSDQYLPMRNRLTHSLLFERFEMDLEKWGILEEEFKEKGESMFDEK